ncbi:MAG: hypothetical protein U0Y82_11950 [Thermoleophilia bacterium]
MANTTEGTPTKLPKGSGPKPQKPGPDEKVRKCTGADLQNGWYGRHGQLYLTDDRLAFFPTILDTALGGHRHEASLDEITKVERIPHSVEDFLPAGKRARMLIHTPRCVYAWMVPDLDAWIDAIEIVYRLRVNAGRPHVPEIVREGVENILLAEE